MIYQPINVWPTTKAIDVFRDNTFSVEINTSGSVIAYQLTILSWDNNIILSDDRVELEEPLYNGEVLYFNPVLTSLENGKDYKWRLRLFQENDTMNITSGFVVSSNDNVVTITRNINIKVGMYIKIDNVTRKIISIATSGDNYDITVDAPFVDATDKIFDILSSFIDTNPDYVLYARTTPNVTISNFANEINERNYTFTGTYYQQEYIPITWFQWQLYIVQNNVRRVIYDTGKKYSANIKFEYDGYLTGGDYQIELIVANEAGVTTTTGMKSFNVFYETVDFLTEPQLYLDCKRHAIRINWTTPITFDSTVLNINNSLSGTVKGIAGNTIQLSPGLEIQIGAIVFFNQEYQNEVAIYNPETGLLALRYSLENEIREGTPFIILNNIGSLNNIVINRNDPYRMSNSASILNNVLTFRNPTGGYIGKTPENDNITFQFKLPIEFWESKLNINTRLLPILRLQTEDANNVRGFEVFVNLNKLVFIKPALDNNNIYRVNIVDIIDDTRIELSSAIDFETQKYIRFVGYNYLAEIVEYDSVSNTVKLFEKPPFDIIDGDSINVYDTLTYDFYTLLAYFPLQEQGTYNSAYDYIWDDTRSWNDTLYWFEGGGAKHRIFDTWFKARVNGKTFDVRAGGV